MSGCLPEQYQDTIVTFVNIESFGRVRDIKTLHLLHGIYFTGQAAFWRLQNGRILQDKSNWEDTNKRPACVETGPKFANRVIIASL